jgi:AraC-like DNA-binding protein
MVSRGARARRQRDSLWIYHEGGPRVCFEQGGQEFLAGTGDLIITDSNQSFRIKSDQNYRHDIWMLPKSLVAPLLPVLTRPLWVPLRGRAGLAGVLAAYLDALGRSMSTLPSPQLDAVADNLARLVAVICGASKGEHRQPVRAALLERAKAHISRHLADPDLGAATAAAALGVSERTLHLAFQPSGVSFADQVMRQRLAECRAALVNPVTGDRSVADIAFGWGFQSLATFYRAFRREFAMAPNELREGMLQGSA